MNTLKFTHRGILPYDPELYQPQKNLLRYVLEQPYSKDMVSAMLSLPKPVSFAANLLFLNVTKVIEM